MFPGVTNSHCPISDSKKATVLYLLRREFTRNLAKVDFPTFLLPVITRTGAFHFPLSSCSIPFDSSNRVFRSNSHCSTIVRG